MKKYNRSTGGYKIDVYLDGVYWYSTDWYRTLKEAKGKVDQTIDPKRITAKFDRI